MCSSYFCCHNLERVNHQNLFIPEVFIKLVYTTDQMIVGCLCVKVVFDRRIAKKDTIVNSTHQD